MAKSAIMSLRIVADAKNAVSGLNKARGAVGNFLKVAGAAAIAAAGAAIVKYGVDAVKMAGELQQSVGAIDTVFKGSATQMHSWAKGAAQDVGLAQNEYNELGTLIGTQLKNGGTAMDQLAPKTNNLIKLGADLSSMFGGTSREAVEALSSALKGERDPIERYGVSLNQAKIDAEAAALGFSKVGGSLSNEANQAATLSLIMKQTADAHGNFAKEANTLQGQQQRVAAEFANIKAQIGTAFLPAITAAFSFVNSTVIPAIQSFVNGLTGAGGATSAFAPIIAKLQPILQVFANIWTNSLLPAIQGFATQAAPLIGTVKETIAVFARESTPIIEGVAKVFAFVWKVISPVVIAVVSGIVTNVIGVIRGLLNVIQGVVKLISAIFRGDWKAAWDAVKQIVSGAVTAVWNLIQITLIGKAFGAIKAGVKAVAVFFKTGFAAVKNTVSIVFGGIKAIGSNIMTAFKAIISRGIEAVLGFFRRIPGNIKGALGNMGNLLTGAGRAIIDGFTRGLRNAWEAGKNFIGGIGDWITKHKGPISYDKVMLKPAGAAIMGGLVKSMKAAMPDLQKVVKQATGTILGLEAKPTVDLRTKSNAGSTGRIAPAAGGVQINVTIQTGVGDPVAIGREVDKVLSKYKRHQGAPA